VSCFLLDHGVYHCSNYDDADDGSSLLSAVKTGFRKARLFLKKPNPLGLLGFGLCWVFQIISSSAKLLFRFVSTLDYLKIRKFVTC